MKFLVLCKNCSFTPSCIKKSSPFFLFFRSLSCTGFITDLHWLFRGSSVLLAEASSLHSAIWERTKVMCAYSLNLPPPKIKEQVSPRCLFSPYERILWNKWSVWRLLRGVTWACTSFCYISKNVWFRIVLMRHNSNNVFFFKQKLKGLIWLSLHFYL